VPAAENRAIHHVSINSRTRVVQQVGDDLEGVALVDQKLLPLGGVVHLLRMSGQTATQTSSFAIIQRMRSWFTITGARTAAMAQCGKDSGTRNASAVQHLRVGGHQRVEEGIVLVGPRRRPRLRLRARQEGGVRGASQTMPGCTELAG